MDIVENLSQAICAVAPRSRRSRRQDLRARKFSDERWTTASLVEGGPGDVLASAAALHWRDRPRPHFRRQTGSAERKKGAGGRFAGRCPVKARRLRRELMKSSWQVICLVVPTFGTVVAMLLAVHPSTAASASPTTDITTYPDGRPSARYRLEARDHGPVLHHGDGPGQCDHLGAPKTPSAAARCPR